MVRQCHNCTVCPLDQRIRLFTWHKRQLPCKHFCAVFNLGPGWSWDSLCLAYRKSPLFVLDEVCLDHDGSDTFVPSYTGCHSTVTEPSDQSSSKSTVLTNPRTKAQESQKCGSLIIGRQGLPQKLHGRVDREIRGSSGGRRTTFTSLDDDKSFCCRLLGYLLQCTAILHLHYRID